MKTALWLALGLATIMTASTGAQVAPAQTKVGFIRPLLVRPILYMRSMERYTAANGGKFIRFNYEVTNRAAYPAALFTPAPSLPPCGANTNASRTWVDFYKASNNARIYGYCALSSPNGLGSISFSLPEGTAPPVAVYIVIHDRQSGAKGKSNNEVTVLTPPPSG